MIEQCWPISVSLQSVWEGEAPAEPQNVMGLASSPLITDHGSPTRLGYGVDKVAFLN